MDKMGVARAAITAHPFLDAVEKGMTMMKTTSRDHCSQDLKTLKLGLEWSQMHSPGQQEA